MNKYRRFVLLALAVVACFWTFREMQIQAKFSPISGSTGPDVIVGDLHNVETYSPGGSNVGYAIGTTSCNIGDQELLWISSTPDHPVIGQNLFRVKDGRIEHLGQAWLKHGFFALSQSLCGNCQSTDGTTLGVGCSDPYNAGLNGNNGSLHPKGEVNAATGVFPYGGAWPRDNPDTSLNGGRISVSTADVGNAGERYFIEGQYVARDDIEAENELNSISYREVDIDSSNVMSLNGSPTVRMLPAMHAWQAVHPDVEIINVDVPGDGRIVVGFRTVEDGEGFHTEIAIQNQTSDRCVQSVDVSCNSGSITNPGFRDVDYHEEFVYEGGTLGPAYSGTDWPNSIVGSDIEWSTETYAQNKGANAIRWGTLYSFWFDSDARPQQLTLGLFKSGKPAEIVLDIGVVVMGDMNDDGEFNNVDINAFVLALTDPKSYAAQYPDVDVDIVGDFNGDGAFDNVDISGFVAALTGGG